MHAKRKNIVQVLSYYKLRPFICVSNRSRYADKTNTVEPTRTATSKFLNYSAALGAHSPATTKRIYVIADKDKLLCLHTLLS